MPPFPGSRLWGWLGPLAITLFAGYLRFNRLSIPGGKGATLDAVCKTKGGPKACVFDEVYYTHDAYSLFHHGVELNVTNNGAGYVVHPPLGKWMIALGEWIVRDPNFTNTFGWRFMAAIVGTLAVLLVGRIARRMTRSTLVGCIAALLFSLDGLEYVQSRTAMLDIFLMFWVVVSFGCLILDRDQVRGRLADRALTRTYGENGPRVGMRWWLLACGVSVGAACATKWDGLYLIPAYGLLALVWTVGAKRALGVRKPVVSTARARCRADRGLAADHPDLRVPGVVDRLVPQRPEVRLRPRMGEGPPYRLRVHPGVASQSLALPRRDLQVPHRPELVPLLPRERVGLAVRRPPGAVLRGLPAPAGTRAAAPAALGAPA